MEPDHNYKPLNYFTSADNYCVVTGLNVYVSDPFTQGLKMYTVVGIDEFSDKIFVTCKDEEGNRICVYASDVYKNNEVVDRISNWNIPESLYELDYFNSRESFAIHVGDDVYFKANVLCTKYSFGVVKRIYEKDRKCYAEIELLTTLRGPFVYTVKTNLIWKYLPVGGMLFEHCKVGSDSHVAEH